MTIANTETKLVPIDSLKPHPDNPRVGNVEVIAESIARNGFYGSVIVRDGTNVILAGTHRWKAAQAAGMTEIPVTFVKTDAKGAKRILLADNRTSDLGAYDATGLAELLGSLGDFEGTGWDDASLTRVLSDAGYSATADTTTPNFEPAGDEQPRLDQRDPVTCPSCAASWRIGPKGKPELIESDD